MYLLKCFCAWTIVCLILITWFHGFLIMTHLFLLSFPAQIKIPWILTPSLLCCLQWDISHWVSNAKMAKINHSAINMAIFVLIMIFRAATDTNFFVKAEEETFRCISQVGIGSCILMWLNFSLAHSRIGLNSCNLTHAFQGRRILILIFIMWSLMQILGEISNVSFRTSLGGYFLFWADSQRKDFPLPVHPKSPEFGGEKKENLEPFRIKEEKGDTWKSIL